MLSGADQEIGAALRQLVRGREHEVAHRLPVVPIDRLHVVVERERVHRHFRVRVSSHQVLAFDADGAVTQRRSLGGAGDDTDVLGHDPIVPGPDRREARATLRRIMQRDLDKMRRRPFLFPLVLPVLLFIAVMAAAAWLFDARATTVVFVVRHAEVENQADADPDLSVDGRERAARLAKMLSQARPVRGIDAIFASEYKRTQIGRAHV